MLGHRLMFSNSTFAVCVCWEEKEDKEEGEKAVKEGEHTIKQKF